ncbi:hypothetical protein GGS26DRAFT_600403 [Hypomontagnella submonticulosa]|nr:hypothetical protein GGS26DRAFT_600403 [Hypomontagnella submonticulosa]
MASSVPLDQLIPPPTEINDTHKKYDVAIVCIVLTAITTIIVAARLGARLYTKTFGLDDYATIPSILLYIGWTVLAAYVNLSAGVGKPLQEITIPEFRIWYQGIAASSWLYPPMSTAIRVSIILFYMRVFTQGHKSTMTYLLRGIFALQIVYLVVFMILPAFICSPYYYSWNPIERRQHCNDYYYMYTHITLFAVSLLLDLVLLAFPIYPVSRLHMSVKSRWGVGAIFGLGAAASIAAAYKFAIFVDEMNRFVPTDPKWLDHLMSRYIPGQFDRYGYTFWIPCHLEPTVALMGASLPALNHFFRQVWRPTQMFSSKGSSGNALHSGSEQKGLSSGRSGKFRRINNESQVELSQID